MSHDELTPTDRADQAAGAPRAVLDPHTERGLVGPAAVGTAAVGAAAVVAVQGIAAGPARYRGAFLRMLGSELRLMFRRRRNLALLVGLGGLPILIGVAVKASAPPSGGDGPHFLTNISGNGLFLVFTTLAVSMPLFLPLVIGVVSGDSIAGEAGAGTLRYLLTLPVGRGRLLAAKALGLVIFTAAAVGVVVVVGISIGGALFGLHSFVLLSGDTVSLADGLLRTVGVGVFVVLSLTGLLALGLFISTLTEVPIAAMAAVIATTIASEVLDAVPQVSGIHPALFTHNWLGFGEILRGTVDIGTLGGYLALQLAYIAIFGSLAWARFTTSDITS
jgi:ABC-2 type transport system permease protein